MGRNGYGPKWLWAEMVWAEMVMCRNGHGPKWLWAEMTRNQSELSENFNYTITALRNKN